MCVELSVRNVQTIGIVLETKWSFRRLLQKSSKLTESVNILATYLYNVLHYLFSIASRLNEPTEHTGHLLWLLAFSVAKLTVIEKNI